MYIKVAGYTTCFRLRKLKRGVTLTAVNDRVLALQFKFSSVVVKENGVLVDYPAIRSMAGITIDLEILAMGGLGVYIHHN